MVILDRAVSAIFAKLTMHWNDFPSVHSFPFIYQSILQ